MVFPLYIVLNAYRFIIGGEGIFQSLVFSTIILIVGAVIKCEIYTTKLAKTEFFMRYVSLSLL